MKTMPNRKAIAKIKKMILFFFILL
jgi:hypothetical protein